MQKVRLIFGMVCLISALIIWFFLIPDAFKPSHNDPGYKSRMAAFKQRDRIPEQAIEFAKDWRRLAVAIAGTYHPTEKAKFQQICTRGTYKDLTVQNWPSDYYFSCLAVAASNPDVCRNLPKYVSNAEALPEAHLECIQNTIRFGKIQERADRHRSCEPIKAYRDRPELYVRCRSWLETKSDYCLLLPRYTTNRKEGHTHVMQCLMALAQYTRKDNYCQKAEDYLLQHQNEMALETIFDELHLCPLP